MRDVVVFLLLAPAVGLVDRLLHRVGDLVGVHDRRAVQMARGAADGLDQRLLGAQEAFLVGVQDRDQADLGQVQTLAQQVDADDHVVHAQAQVAQDLDPLEGLHFGVQVVDLDAQLLQIVGQVLGHALGQRGHQHALAVAPPACGSRPPGRPPGPWSAGSPPADRPGRSGG